MLKLTVDEKNHIVHGSPDGKLSEDDIERLGKTIDGYIKDHGQAPCLLIDATEFPHWDNFTTFKTHMKLIKDHEKLIPKIAVVSDDSALVHMSELANHFVKADIKHFHADKMDDAKKWLEEKVPASAS